MKGFHLLGFASKFSLTEEHNRSLKFCAAYAVQCVVSYRQAAASVTFPPLQPLLLDPLGNSKQVAHAAVAGINSLITCSLTLFSKKALGVGEAGLGGKDQEGAATAVKEIWPTSCYISGTRKKGSVVEPAMLFKGWVWVASGV